MNLSCGSSGSVSVDVAGHDLDDVVDTAAGGVALGDFGAVLHGLLEALEGFAVVLLEADFHQHCGALEQNFGIKLGAITADDPRFFQTLDPLPAGADRQVDGFGQAGLGDPPITLQDAQNLQVIAVQTHKPLHGEKGFAPARGLQCCSDMGIAALNPSTRVRSGAPRDR